MCSISGIFNTGPSSPKLRSAIQRMNSAQHHRGPDDFGVENFEFSGGELFLANTRLAIIDTSRAGHQPMSDPTSGNCITYNGETYNFKDLRRELTTNGESWLSTTDTEVVLRAFCKWGITAFQRLRGMFALALWDQKHETLVLARDRFGIKPLYYYRANDQLIFASELRALLASGLVPKRLSPEAIGSYLNYGSVQAPLAIIDGVRQLLPGHCLQINANKNGEIALSDDLFATERPLDRPTSRSDAVTRLRCELEESVRSHLISDVPLGVFLSGGMDSSALVALLSRISDERPTTFSVTFDEATFTETPFSRAVAERFKTDHSEIPLSEERLLEVLPRALAAIDQPTMDGINTFVVSSAVRDRGIKVALSGLGGDELFAGYPSFRRALKLGAMSQTSRRVMRVAAGVGTFALNGSVKHHKLLQLAKSECSPRDVYEISRQLFAADKIREICGSFWADQSSNGHDSESDVVNAISRWELGHYMTNTLLRDTDAMSMADSLEVRVPFVDTNVVDYVLSIPGEWKLWKGCGPKPLLADALADLLPLDFLRRPKMGFTLPFEKWLQQNLRPEVEAVLSDEQRLKGAGLNVKAVRAVWRSFLQKPGAVGWSRPWALYVLVKWCEINDVS